ncbi:G protein-regulated inducer of neurite outgrowth C-terminus [Sparganum proliferum]
MPAKLQPQRDFEENDSHCTESSHSTSSKRCFIQRRSISLAAGEQLLKGSVQPQIDPRRFRRQVSVDESSPGVANSRAQSGTTASSVIMTKLRNFRRQLYIHMLESAALSNDVSRALPRDAVCDLYFGEGGTASPRTTSTVHLHHLSCLRKTSKAANDSTESMRNQTPTTPCEDSPRSRGQTRSSRGRQSPSDAHTHCDQFFSTSSRCAPHADEKVSKPFSVSAARANKCMSCVERTSGSVTLSRNKSASVGAYVHKSSKVHHTPPDDGWIFIQKMKTEKQREVEPPATQNAQSSYHLDVPEKKPTSGFRDVEYDERGQTWEIYGADQDPKALGKAIEDHLEKLMQRMHSKEQNRSLSENTTQGETFANASGKASSAQFSCEEHQSTRLCSQRRAVFQKRAVSHHYKANFVQSVDILVSEDEPTDNPKHKGKVLTRINRLLHRSFASVAKDHVASDPQSCSTVDSIHTAGKVLSAPKKCTLSSFQLPTAGNTDQILVSANS